MVARNRRMPRGRPGMPSWSLAQNLLLRHRFWAAELLICGPQQLRYCQPATDFGLRAPLRQLCYCGLRKILSCERKFRFLLDILTIKPRKLDRINAYAPGLETWIMRRAPTYGTNRVSFATNIREGHST